MLWGLLALASHWRRAPLQLAAIIVGLSLATALWSAVQAINTTARASYASATQQLTLLGTDRIIARNQNFTLQNYTSLRRQGWLISPVFEGDFQIQDQKLPLMAVDMLSHPIVDTLFEDQSVETTPQAFLPSDLPLFAHPQTLEEIAPTDREFRAVDALPRGLVIGDFASVLNHIPDANYLSYAVVLKENRKSLDLLPDEFSFTSGARIDPGQLTNSFHLNLTAFGLLAFIVGLFIVQSTIKLALEQRRHLFRTLRCLGLPLRGLVALCLAELLGIALLSAVIGLLLGYFTAAALLPGVSATVSGLYGADELGALSLQRQWVNSGIAMTVLGTFIAAAGSMIQVHRLPILQGPAASARSLASVKNRRVELISGVLLLFISPSLLILDSLIASFALMGALMLGCVLLVPSLLAGAIVVMQNRSTNAIAEWVWADMRVLLTHLNVPLMALSLAVATNIGVETMTSSFRLTFVDWLEQRFSADLYINVNSDDQAAQIITYLSEQGLRPRPLVTAELQDQSHPTRLWAVVDDPYYATTWPMIASQPNSWENVHKGSGVMINEQMARARALSPGDELHLPNVGEVSIEGVYPDYGNPDHQIILSPETIQLITPSAETSNISVNTRDIHSTINALLRDFNLDRSALLDQTQLKETSLMVFDQTFLITAALNILTLAVAGFALLTSFASLWSQRQPQLAPIWAMGMPQDRLARIEVLRSLVLALLTALISIPIGLMLAWVLLSVTNVLAFGWKIPLYIFPFNWLRIVLLSLLAAAVACIPTAIKLYRTDPSQMLKVFASER